MNVLVMGPGGVGGYFGALLSRAGHAVTVVARGAHLEAMRRDGLRIETVAGPSFTAKVHAVERATAPVDLVLFTVKCYDTPEAVELVRAAVGPRTAVLTLQNGVDSGEELARAFGWEQVLDGVVYIESHVKAPGVIAQAGGPRRIIFGRRGGNRERERNLLKTVRAAGWQAELDDDILDPLWTKLSFIGPYAALNTLTGLTGDAFCAQPEAAELARAVVAEYVAVANAAGALLPPEAVEATVERIRGFRGLSSMYRDRLAGKRLEVDALVGVVVRKGEALSVPTPLTAVLSSLLAPMRDGGHALGETVGSGPAP